MKTPQMRNKIVWTFVLVLLAALITGLTPATIASQTDTEDIVVLVDGREIRGTILNETASFVVIEVRTGGIRSELRFSKNEIDRIDRDVPVARPADRRDQQRQPERRTEREVERPAGVRSVVDEDADVARVYHIPMKGQMGTDIHHEVYMKLREDILRLQPDLIVFEMHCSDRDDLLIPLNDPRERGLFTQKLSEYRDLIHFFKTDFRHIDQVMWVHDSYGVSSLIALAWEDMYMTPNARLAGLAFLSQMAEGFGDQDVKAKMLAAWTGVARGLIEHGGYAVELAEAMMRPELKLGATFRGREVIWSLAGDGEWVVNDRTDQVAAFTAKTAEDLLISSGTAETLDDLMFLLGHREFRLLDTQVPQIVERYKDDWRRRFEESVELFQDYQKYLSWAQGNEAIANLGRARSAIDRIIRLMSQYDAIETRWLTDYGIHKIQLEILREQLGEQIATLRRQQRGR